MNCTHTSHETNTAWEPLPDEKLQAEQVRNRQAAVLYLQAAAMADDAVVRDRLRLQGAQLLLPRTC